MDEYTWAEAIADFATGLIMFAILIVITLILVGACFFLANLF